MIQRQFDIEEDSIRCKSRSARCAWVGVSWEGKLWFAGYGSPDTPCLCWEQLAPELVQIGERKHGLRAGQILSQTAVSDLGKAPQLLDHPKRVFAAGPGPRACLIDQAPALGQRPLRGASIDPVAYAVRGKRLAAASFQYAWSPKISRS